MSYKAVKPQQVVHPAVNVIQNASREKSPGASVFVKRLRDVEKAKAWKIKRHGLNIIRNRGTGIPLQQIRGRDSRLGREPLTYPPVALKITSFLLQDSKQ